MSALVKVFKFGGSSLANSERYRAVAQIIASHLGSEGYVVVSAAGKTTDTLLNWFAAVQAGQQIKASEIRHSLFALQAGLIQGLLPESEQAPLLALLQEELTTAASLLQAEHASCPAAVQGLGELWSARLLAAFIASTGSEAHCIDARALFCVRDGALLAEHSLAALAEVRARTGIKVVTGFIARDEQGHTVTLGRNGSDYSAALLASIVGAQQVTIWTDTQGLYSADPRIVRGAIKYNKVCRNQSEVLAKLGNPVLHVKTLKPLLNTDIELVIRSSYEPYAGFTRVVPQGEAKQKRFITVLSQHVGLQLSAENLPFISQLETVLQQPIVRLPSQPQRFFVPQSALAQVQNVAAQQQVALTELYANCALTALVCESGAARVLANKALAVVRSNSELLCHDQADDYLLFVSQERLTEPALQQLHEQCVRLRNALAVIVAGVGNVGETFLNQLVNQQQALNQAYPVALVGVVNSKKQVFDATGLVIADWQNTFAHAAVDYQEAELLDAIAALDFEHKVVVDITPSAYFAQLYPQFVARGCHLISANKQAGTADFHWYQQLQQQLAHKQLHWRYNTTVGAGLPVNYALTDLQRSGDRIERIEGVFSGTLSWLGVHYTGAQAFSELVLQAKALGYTEPDARDDLSGKDVQRKLLILARELGLSLDLDDIELTPLMPAQLAQGDWASFIGQREQLDQYLAELSASAQQANGVIRYVAELDLTAADGNAGEGRIVARVAPKIVSKDSALAAMKAGDNIFQIQSHWYHDNPLVIQGPGAGREVTACGIHSDLYWLCQALALEQGQELKSAYYQ